jgi:hypothetical protein
MRDMGMFVKQNLIEICKAVARLHMCFSDIFAIIFSSTIVRILRLV